MTHWYNQLAELYVRTYYNTYNVKKIVLKNFHGLWALRKPTVVKAFLINTEVGEKCKEQEIHCNKCNI